MLDKSLVLQNKQKIGVGLPYILKEKKQNYMAKSGFPHCLRPYHVENTSSRLITEVKQHWAMLVLGWVTAWEYMVL